MMDDSVLIVAFDGLDYDLIQRYDCRTFLEMEEFGRIDNQTGIDTVVTCELFASFITGKTHEDHGVTEVKTWINPKKGHLIDAICTKWRRRNIRGFQRLYELLKRILGADRRWYDKSDIPVQTLFDTVLDSKAIDVSAYNPHPLQRLTAMWDILNVGGSLEDSRALAEMEHRDTVSKLNSLLDEPAYSLAMCHLAKPDQYQHLYAGDKALEDWNEVKKMYKEIDSIASSILEKATPKYDTVLFMSDHGLPSKNQHNENAFYAVTTETEFDTPHITDFYQWIVDRTGQTGERELTEEISY